MEFIVCWPATPGQGDLSWNIVHNLSDTSLKKTDFPFLEDKLMQ